jgi:Phage small terminase subunit
MNFVRALRQEKLARQAAEAEAALNAAPAKGATSRADGMGGIIRPDAATNEAVTMLVKLTSDRARLKQIQSTEAKIEAKRGMIPEYKDYLVTLLKDLEALPIGQINEVLATLTLWLIDTGDFVSAMDLVDVVLARQIPAPASFNRDMPTAIVDEICDAALKAALAKAPFDMFVLDQLQAFIDPVDLDENGDTVPPIDMPDQARAKLFKAKAMLRDNDLQTILDSGETPDGVAGGIPALIDDILTNIRRAIELDEGCGVKSLLSKMERLEKKHRDNKNPATVDAAKAADTAA